MKKNKAILIDMDGTIADFNKELLKVLYIRHPNAPVLTTHDIVLFETKTNFPEEYHNIMEEIFHEEGFFERLEPFVGAVEALQEIQKHFEVRICTSPLTRFEYCITEKYKWIQCHLGQDWVGKIIPSKDKTFVRGNILIDDKPEVHGHFEAEWEHILYDQPYNRHCHQRRINWQNYKEILEIWVLKKSSPFRRLLFYIISSQNCHIEYSQITLQHLSFR